MNDFRPLPDFLVETARNLSPTRFEDTHRAQYSIAELLKGVQVHPKHFSQINDGLIEVIEELEKSNGSYAADLVDALSDGLKSLDAQRSAWLQSQNGKTDAERGAAAPELVE